MQADFFLCGRKPKRDSNIGDFENTLEKHENYDLSKLRKG